MYTCNAIWLAKRFSANGQVASITIAHMYTPKSSVSEVFITQLRLKALPSCVPLSCTCTALLVMRLVRLVKLGTSVSSVGQSMPFSSIVIPLFLILCSLASGLPLYWSVRDLHVVELVLAHHGDCVGICSEGESATGSFNRKGEREAGSVGIRYEQIAMTAAVRPIPVTAFLTRYGRLARIRAGDCRICRS